MDLLSQLRIPVALASRMLLTRDFGTFRNKEKEYTYASSLIQPLLIGSMSLGFNSNCRQYEAAQLP